LLALDALQWQGVEAVKVFSIRIAIARASNIEAAAL
jgi:hypothetical protein